MADTPSISCIFFSEIALSVTLPFCHRPLSPNFPKLCCSFNQGYLHWIDPLFCHSVLIKWKCSRFSEINIQFHGFCPWHEHNMFPIILMCHIMVPEVLLWARCPHQAIHEPRICRCRHLCQEAYDYTWSIDSRMLRSIRKLFRKVR